MNLRQALRGTAVALIAVAILDPGWARQPETPLPVVVRAAANRPDDLQTAEQIRQRLGRSRHVDLRSADSPRAVVLAGSIGDASALPTAVPVSVVVPSERARNLRLVAADAPLRMVAGHYATLTATVAAVGIAGETSRVAIESEGGELAGVERTWRAERHCRF